MISKSFVVALFVVAFVVLCCTATSTHSSLFHELATTQDEKTTVAFSPFTKFSNYVEVTIKDIPITEDDGNEYEFVVSTGGFLPKKQFESETEELYLDQKDSTWKSVSTRNLHQYNSKSTTNFRLKTKFTKVKKALKANGYKRVLRLRLDVKEWPAPEVTFDATLIATKTKKSTKLPQTVVAPFVALADSMKISLSKSSAKGAKSNHNDFTVKIPKLSLDLGPDSHTLTLYSQVKDYSITSLTPQTPHGDCKVNGTPLSAEWNKGDQETQSFVRISLDNLTQPIPAGKSVTITCPDFVVYKDQTGFHFSEYWVLYTGTGQAHITQYVPGTNRLDQILSYAGWIIFILFLIVVIVVAIISYCVCKKTNKCCFKKKEQQQVDTNLPNDDFYTSL